MRLLVEKRRRLGVGCGSRAARYSVVGIQCSVEKEQRRQNPPTAQRGHPLYEREIGVTHAACVGGFRCCCNPTLLKGCHAPRVVGDFAAAALPPPTTEYRLLNTELPGCHTPRTICVFAPPVGALAVKMHLSGYCLRSNSQKSRGERMRHS